METQVMTQVQSVLKQLRSALTAGGAMSENGYKALYFDLLECPLPPNAFEKQVAGACSQREAMRQGAESHIFGLDDLLAEEQRILSGSYYTPTDLVRVLWDHTLTQYFANREGFDRLQLHRFFRLEATDHGLYNFVRPKLETLVVADIAAGTGQMLVGFILLLEALDQKHGKSSMPIDLSHFHLCDIQLEALECALIACINWRQDNRIATLPKFVHGDSLLGENPLARHLDLKSCDIIIGNPPYLGEKGHKEVFEALRRDPWAKKHYEGRMDLFYFFIYRGLELLKPKGVLGYITTRYFVTADGAAKLRQHLSDNARFLAFFNIEKRAFKSAPGQANCLFVMSPESELTAEVGRVDDACLSHLDHADLPSHALFDQNGHILVSASAEVYAMAKQYSTLWSKLADHFTVNQGLVSGCDRYGADGKDAPCFVFHTGEAPQESSHLKPFYKNSDIDAYFIKTNDPKQILYLTDKSALTEMDWEWQHLSIYREHLEKRREVKTGVRQWYALHWYRTPDCFEGPKLVSPQRSAKPRFAYVEKPFYGSADIYYIKHKQRDTAALKALMVYLNSAVADYYFYHFGKRKGKDLELYATPLGQMPLPAKADWVEHLLPYADAILHKGTCPESLQREIDEAVCGLMAWDDTSTASVLAFEEWRTEAK